MTSSYQKISAAKLKNAEVTLKSVKDCLVWAEQAFIEHQLYYGHGTDNPWDEAVALLLHVLNLPWTVEPSLLLQNLELQQIQEFLRLAALRINTKKPVPYIIQEAYFANLAFYVDERVLIPRSPLAEVIENGFLPWSKEKSNKKILDMGTGSACIAIACAYYLPDAIVDAVDCSSQALAVAQINIKKHGMVDRVRLVESNLFSALTSQTYDIIVANLPYVDASDMSLLPDEYRHEPELALAAGEDGLTYVIPLLEQAARFLTADGIILCEVGNSDEALINRYPDLPMIWLEFERGGDGVCLIYKQDLQSYF